MLNYGSRGEDFYNCQCIFTISLLSPLEKGGALHLNKLEYSLLKEGSCQDCQNWQNGSGEEDL